VGHTGPLVPPTGGQRGGTVKEMKHSTRNKRDRQRNMAQQTGGAPEPSARHNPNFKLAVSREMPGAWWDVQEWRPDQGLREGGAWRGLLAHLDLERAMDALARTGAILPSPSHEARP
jgi:hypothetical protein